MTKLRHALEELQEPRRRAVSLGSVMPVALNVSVRCGGGSC